MKQLTTNEELAGKTIVRAKKDDSENDFYIFFSDNTFCVIKDNGWTCDDHDICLSKDIVDMTPTHHNAFRLCNLGVISEAEEASINYQRQIAIGE